jgi:hypothetical protein
MGLIWAYPHHVRIEERPKIRILKRDPGRFTFTKTEIIENYRPADLPPFVEENCKFSTSVESPR